MVEAGWSYRVNERGWIIYKDPETNLWHPRVEAIAILEERSKEMVAGAGAGTPEALSGIRLRQDKTRF